MRFLVHHLLEDAARSHPDDLAVIDGERSLTYGELDRQSNRIAQLLCDRGVVKGDRVGLYLDKSLESIVGVYGIMKTGAAYVPFDPDAPIARLAYIAIDCGIRHLVTGSEKLEQLRAIVDAVASVETIVILNAAAPDIAVAGASVLGQDQIAASSIDPVGVAIVDQDLAYVLYTSGSTGEPKGVMLTHRNAVAFIAWASEEFDVARSDRLSNHAPLHFDLSVFDIYSAAYSGATVVLVPPKTSLFPNQIVRFIQDNEITIWYSVPSILSMITLRGGLNKTTLPTIRTILFAGEVFPVKYLRELMRLVPHARYANLYGPTETNVCTWYEVGPLDESVSEPVPIGIAVDNDEVFAVKEDGRMAQPGEVGELYVRGATVMRGYWGDPGRTAQGLVPDPFGLAFADPVYRTGDLVEVQSEGSYRFVGRKDAQVKSRGYRIELGDVEATLNLHPGIIECAVVAVPDDLVTNRLIAFVTVRDQSNEAELARFCGERLPRYMIPESFTLLSEMPKTSTGKIDRRSLLVQTTV